MRAAVAAIIPDMSLTTIGYKLSRVRLHLLWSAVVLTPASRCVAQNGWQSARSPGKTHVR